MLKAESLSFKYDNAPWLFENLNFTIKPGEVVGLPGPSGQGKSTLARILADYLTPQKGRVTYMGQPLPKTGFCPVQLLFQHPEAALNPRWKLGNSIAEAYKPDEATLRRLNIEPHWLSRFPHELSGGELQRLALARAMTPATRFLIADEMTAMLDPNTQAMVWDAVLDWAQKNGVGILAISHDRHLLGRVADRIDETFAPQNEKKTHLKVVRIAA
ncbi:ATP-binding cassette domain-containing protein [Pseudodesulfovibrio sp. zrk46]|uniref:ABC transporter ATP-binding protein n=1 Tax=Pseudodesulfovibrio sp. zrk46 TaxID=2725288 RepID=UPI001448EF7D|nr:ATP-binding cassette domain-containing protein [Pseudodesulfovibrio sp. zrk46]QJB56810.1 ATP-binding cassette domain-containing protein [Pseudodesulfovibrio sp. zrk46]